MTRTVVIGGGVAGLATAALLAHEGHDVVVLEKNTRVGGRAGLIERDGFRFDTGPSWYLMPDVFEHFFHMLGTSVAEQLDLTYLEPGYRVFSEPGTVGARRGPLTVPRGREQVQEVFESVEPGSAVELNKYLDSAQHTTRLAEKYFLYNPFTRLSSFLNRDLMTRLLTLARLLRMSLQDFVHKRFSDSVLRQVLGYPAVFLGTNPADAPAMYHLMSAFDLDDGVQYPRGGFWTIIERLEAIALAAGVRIVTGAHVERIETRSSGSGKRRHEVSGVVWHSAGGSEMHEPADIVVSAADLHHTETQLLAPELQTYPERWWERRTSGPGAVIAMLGVKGELPELPHHSLFFTEDWDKNFKAIFGDEPQVPDPASIYVCKPSATDATVAPAGHENLFVLIPVPADVAVGKGGADGAGDLAVEHAADAAVAQISEWANIPDLAERVVVREVLGPADFAADYFSWKGGMLGPAHILSQSAMFRAQNESKKVRGLYYAGATTAPGVGVPMCLISAEVVLKRIRGDHSPGPLAVPSDVRLT